MTGAGSVPPTERLASWISTVGPVGYCPVGPGTAAAILSLGAVFVLVRWVGINAWIPVFFPTLIIGQWACAHIPSQWGADPKRVVVDEVAGQMLAVALLPPSAHLYLAAFVLFRFLDIWKPGPIRLIETRAGAWAVMGDDLLAGGVARLILAGIQLG